MEQLITTLKEFTALAVAAVGFGFTIYNTVISDYNRRALIEHRRALDTLQLNATPPGTATAPKETP